MLTARQTDYGRGYMEYLPTVYSPENKYPVIIFLHGSGERGSGSLTDLEKLKANGPLKWMKTNTQFIILCPQTDAWCWRTTKTLIDGSKVTTNDANEFTKWAIENYPIDSRRVYITGLSMGGEGTWFALADAPELYTAGAPVCGRASRTEGTKIANANIQVWAFHGSADTSILFESDWNAIAGFRSVKKVMRFTVYEDVTHNCWDRAYRTDHLYHSKSVYEWFLTYSKP